MAIQSPKALPNPDSIQWDRGETYTSRANVEIARRHLANMPREYRAKLEREWAGEEQS